MRILLAEDDSKISNFVSMSLGKYADCDVAKTGDEAIDLYTLLAYINFGYDLFISL